MILDANLLLYARDETSPSHDAARNWLTTQLNGTRRVGLPWQTLGAFLRISTHPRIMREPLSAAAAWAQVQAWLEVQTVWTPHPGPGYARILGDLVERHDLTGNLVPDAQLAALAIEHGLTVCSTDTDFARFHEARWLNPLAIEARAAPLDCYGS